MGKNIMTYQKRLNLIDECLRRFDHPMNIKEIQKYCNQRLNRKFTDRTYRYDLEKIEMENDISYRVTVINGFQCFTYADESFSINNNAVVNQVDLYNFRKIKEALGDFLGLGLESS